MNPEVTVVIPAFNAGLTLRETLASVSAQTFGDIEIIVVDDGSADDTAEVARSAALADSRIRYLHQPNAGVAAARNAGIRAGRGTFVAPIDADDIWHPTNLQKQLALFRRDPELGLVYSNWRLIDEASRVIKTAPRCTVESWVYAQHLAHNIVGNGSAIMMRRDISLAVGGYDPRLRQAGVEGCEDYLLQIQIARRSRFGVVPEPLVGYRKRQDAMSVDAARMLASRITALTLLEAEGAPAPHLIREARAAIRVALVILYMRKRRPQAALRQLGQALRDASPASWAQVLDHGLSRAIRNMRGRLVGRAPDPAVQRPFLEASPEQAVSVEQPPYVQRLLRRLAAVDEAYASPGRSFTGAAARRAAMRMSTG